MTNYPTSSTANTTATQSHNQNANKGILDMNAFDHHSTQPPAAKRRLANQGAAAVLFYQQPIEMVSAQGAWMQAADGTEYLDCYNNVPCIGHSHPAVTEAVSQQLGKLNTHTRYLVDVVDEYLEALKAQLPAELSNVMLTCSGSEANDLAMRVAMAHSGARGFIVTEAAYHGNTALVTDVSPSSLKRGQLPDHVVTVPAPAKSYYAADIRDPQQAELAIRQGFARDVQGAIDTLQQRGHGVAGLLVDSVFSSDGIHTAPQGFLADAVAAVKRAGGLYLADEVQPGFGRLGSHFWGFQFHGLIPDVVTMGKPMGNGFPMAAMVTRPDLLADFCQTTGYFNTFGGNPVACAAGLAVLQVLKQENLLANASQRGKELKQGLLQLAREYPTLAEVRGQGLFIGVDIQNASGQPCASTTKHLIEQLKQQKVLSGAAGLQGATLKLRPSMTLNDREVDFFLTAMRVALRKSTID